MKKTDRKLNVENQFKESEEHFRLLFENMSEGVAIKEMLYDKKGNPVDYRILSINSAFERITRITSKKSIGSLASELFGISPPPYITEYNTVFKTGKTFSFETYFPPLDTYFQISVFSSKKNQFITVFLDITKHKQAELALMESEKKFRTLFDNSEVGMFRSQLDGSKVLEFNEKYLKILNYTSEELADKLSVNMWANKDERDNMVKKINADGQVTDLEFDLLTEQGEVKRCITSIKLYPDTGILEGSIIDITERKQAEQKLQKLNRALQAISDCNQAMIHATEEIELLNKVCRIITEVGGYRMAWVGYAEQGEDKNIRPVAKAGYEEGYLETLHISWADNEFGQGPTGLAIRTGQPNINRNVLTNTNYDLWRTEANKRGYVTSIALPLKIDGKVLGTLNIYSVSPDVFNTEETKLLTQLTEDLAYGVATIRTRQQETQVKKDLQKSITRIEHLNDVLQSIRNMQQIILREKNPQHLLQAACRILVQTRDYVTVWVGQTEEDSKRVIKVAEAGAGENSSQLAQITWDDSPSGKGPSGTAIRERRTVVVNDIRTDPNFVLWRQVVENSGAFSIASTPLLAGKQLFGAITVKADHANAFDAEEVELLNAAAKYLAQALQSIADEDALRKSRIELTESETLLRSITETSNDIIFVKDKACRFIFMNPAGCKFNSKTLEQLKGKLKADFCSNPIEAAQCMVDDQRIIDSGQLETIEEAFTAADGTIHTFLTTKIPRLDSEGNIIGLIGMSHNITERKKIEKSLKVSEDKYRTMVEYSNDMIWALDINGNFTFFNEVAAKTAGLNQNEWIGKSFVPLIMPEDLPMIFDIFQRTITGEACNYELRLKKSEENVLLISVNTSPIYVSGEIAGVVSFGRDITELKQTEKSLYESEKLFYETFHQSPVTIVLTDPLAGTLLDINNTFLKFMEYTRDEVIGKNVLDLGIYYDLKEREVLNKTLNENGSVFGFECHFQSKSGKVLIGLTSAAILTIKGKKRQLTTVIDITERKQTEKALIESQRLSAIGEMASSIAHDFNNSLQSIYGTVEILLHNPDLSEDIIESLKTIRTSAGDAAKRIKQIQYFGGRKNTKSHYSSLDINILIADVIMQTRPLWKDEAEQKGITIDIKPVYNNIPKVSGNDGEIRSVLYNIFKNSIEAMPEGGRISIKTGKKSKDVFINITDTGIGMDEETSTRLFQPFYTTKGFDAGRGLGMSGVYSIIKEHNGTILIKDTAPGMGTSIEITLQISDTETDTETETETDTETKICLKVLWVEDDAVIRLNAGLILEMLGHKVDTASSGKEALKYLQEKIYDIIFTDIGMPEMNGWQLAKIIKEKFNGKIKVAFITGWGAEIDEAKRNKYGVEYILGKPFTIEQIEKLLGEVAKQNSLN